MAKSSLEKARNKLLEAAQRYEDESHVNECEMDACVECERSNLMATLLRIRACEVNQFAKKVLERK